jgi:Ca2+-binding RTX toxin-like protein
MPTINGTANGETLNGTAGQDSIFGLGGDDILFGFLDADLLDGGEGRDTMSGGTGNDRYVVDDMFDTIVETPGEGDDTLHSSVSYALGAGTSIEAMTTMNAAGSAAINFTGNGFGQSIYGNAGANWLNGGGGADYLIGLNGDDVYAVDDLTDAILEATGEGDDRLISSSNYILRSGVSVETLGTANAASAAAQHLTGNEFGQSIYGSAGENWLSGGGGSDYLLGLEGNDILWGGDGSDYLVGGAGADVFSFNHESGVDFIADFESGTDKINLGHFLGSLQIQFIGGSAFSGSAGQARFANGRFELDVDGDRRPELTVMVQGNVAAGDFYFWDDVGYGTGGWDGSGAGWWDY